MKKLTFAIACLALTALNSCESPASKEGDQSIDTNQVVMSCKDSVTSCFSDSTDTAQVSDTVK